SRLPRVGHPWRETLIDGLDPERRLVAQVALAPCGVAGQGTDRSVRVARRRLKHDAIAAQRSVRSRGRDVEQPGPLVVLLLGLDEAGGEAPGVGSGVLADGAHLAAEVPHRVVVAAVGD